MVKMLDFVVSGSSLFWRSTLITSEPGYRIARVRAVFTLQPEVTQAVFGSADAVQQLAYVEWYTKLTAPSATHGMYSVQPSINTQGYPEGAVIELGQIRQSVHLFPKFPKEVAKDSAALKWTSETVLDQCPEFFVNRYLSRYSFQMLLS